MTLRVLVSCLLCIALSLPAQAARAAEPLTVLDGVYTTAQANRGKRSYDRYCKECHLSDLEGGALEPPLVSVLFLDAWREDALFSLYDFIATRMPKSKEHRPGTLKDTEYLEILTYILQRNDFPAGTRALDQESLHTVQLVGPEGPMPLPPNAMVRTAGCLLGTDGNYRLEQAVAPARVRTGDETDARELAGSTAQGPGELTFKLNNLDVVDTAEPVTAMTGQRVQAKGVMNGSGATARIFVLSLVTLGTCSP